VSAELASDSVPIGNKLIRFELRPLGQQTVAWSGDNYTDSSGIVTITFSTDLNGDGYADEAGVYLYWIDAIFDGDIWYESAADGSKFCITQPPPH
jgi:hypothetical protein